MIENNSEIGFKKTVRRKTLRAFAWFFLFLVLLFAGWKWLVSRPEDAGALGPLRSAMNVNEKIFSKAFSADHLSPEYSKSEAVKDVRVNGDIGMGDEDEDDSNWKMQVIRYSEHLPFAGDTFFVSLDDLKKLPKTEVIFNFKCIEGWSQVTWWAGVKFSDFAAAYNLGTKSGKATDKNHPEDFAKYAGFYTPDMAYYVGIDMASMLHPQTILCYEMNGEPLPKNQGAPLRLIIPVKYGVKHLKHIGTLYFSDSPPPDYWAEQGYDYYAGL